MNSPQVISVAVTKRTDEDMTIMAQIQVAHLSTAQRVTGAFGYLFACWGAGALFILIPILHFILVPLAVLGGVVAFFYRLKMKEQRSPATLECPSCHSKITLKKAAFNWPMQVHCPDCNTALKIQPPGMVG